MDIDIKRAYAESGRDDGFRILVDRLWPRGINKDLAEIGLWPKETAPSTELRKWFNHDPEKWEEFKKRYLLEIKRHPEEIGQIKEYLRKGKVTFVYSSKETRYNNAVALKEFFERGLL